MTKLLSFFTMFYFLLSTCFFGWEVFIIIGLVPTLVGIFLCIHQVFGDHTG